MQSNFVFVLLLLTFATDANAGKSLEDCFQASLHQSESIQISEEQVKQARETYLQAFGALSPSITSTASYLKQASPAQSDVARGIFPTTQPNFKITLTQPLFQGFAEYAGLRQTQHLSQAQKESQKNAMLQLYISVSQSFYAVLSAEKDFQNLKTEIEFYNKRITELEHRVKIGLDQKTDVLSTKAIMGGLKAQLEQDRGQITIHREALAFLTGFEPTVSLDDREEYPGKPQKLETYLEGQYVRPDIKINQHQLFAAQETVNAAHAGHLPTINLITDYYFIRPQGLQQGIHWDISANISFPIFSGGIVESKIRAAASVARQNQLNLNQTQRQAIQQIRTYYATLVADQAQVVALESATQISEKTYIEEIRNYRLGLVTNIDVLTALATFQENNRSYDKMKFTVKQDQVNLEIASLKRKVFE